MQLRIKHMYHTLLVRSCSQYILTILNSSLQQLEKSTALQIRQTPHLLFMCAKRFQRLKVNITLKRANSTM